MEPKQLWIESLWPHVLGSLPPPPAIVVEIGCGRHGGFVPALLQDGFQAVGIDPQAPEGEAFQQVEFERAELPPEVHAVVACTSLHHVADPAQVVHRIADALAPGGIVVIIEWDWQRFDRATADWCFARLGQPAEDDHESWLQRARRHWIESQQPWEDYLRSWAEREHIHRTATLIAELDRRLERASCKRGPFFFADLEHTSESDELAAITAGEIQATRVDWVGRLSA